MTDLQRMEDKLDAILRLLGQGKHRSVAEIKREVDHKVLQLTEKRFKKRNVGEVKDSR